MTIPVVWKSYTDVAPRGIFWDQGMLEDIFSKEMWNPVLSYDFEHHTEFTADMDGAVVVLPARNQVQSWHELNADIQTLRWVVLILTGDEEAVFPFEHIDHPNIRYWVMSPKPDRHTDKGHPIQALGAGYPPHARAELKKHKEAYLKKPLDWFFSGQVNHERREQAGVQMEKLIRLKGETVHGEYKRTGGFTQGLDAPTYYKKLAATKVSIVPGGGFTPETFRLFESLEAGTIPMTDELAATYPHKPGYWDWFFGAPPAFPTFSNYDGLYDYVLEALKTWQERSIKIFSWWQQEKRKLTYRMASDIQAVSQQTLEPASLKDKVTVLIPTSPAPKTRNTKMISETIELTRQWFPESEIILMIDGIREEQKEQYQEAYTEYVRELLWKCNFEWHNVLPLVFETHHHQVAMTRKALELVKTPLILFNEHDCPLTPDNYIDMEGIVRVLMSGEFNVIRFHHEAMILDGAKQFMFDHESKKYDGVPLVRTYEWSQRPHLASTAWYKRMSDQYFSENARTMYEDVLHGRITSECANQNLMAWYNWRVGIYHPDGHIKRSSNFDGREGDEKYAEKYIF